MNKNIKKSINNFLSNEVESEEEKIIKEKKAFKKISNNVGLIERIDKIILTENGKQLLREQY